MFLKVIDLLALEGAVRVRVIRVPEFLLGPPTSPSSICVPTSLPVLAGMKRGVDDLSSNASVSQFWSEVSMTLLSSSR